MHELIPGFRKIHLSIRAYYVVSMYCRYLHLRSKHHRYATSTNPPVLPSQPKTLATSLSKNERDPIILILEHI